MKDPGKIYLITKNDNLIFYCWIVRPWQNIVYRPLFLSPKEYGDKCEYLIKIISCQQDGQLTKKSCPGHNLLTVSDIRMGIIKHDNLV